MNVRGLKDHRRETEPEFRLNPLSRSVKLALVPGLLLGLAPGAAFGAPTGGQVKAGAASISQNASKSLTSIVQQSQRAAIDWQTFNVQKSQTVHFQQPNVKASTLNRIFDQNPSQIFGNIKANGQVVLMNPNGVFFKPGSRVNVGSLIAGAMQIGIDDFMRGSYRLQALKDAAGRVVNEGTIEAAEGGDVTLVGKSIANRGVIVATAGKVNLVAGEQITVDFDGDGLLRFAVDQEVIDNAIALDDQIENTGDILADGGDVLITASAAEGVFRNAINNSGLVKAGRIQNSGGKIRLVGMGPGASVLNTGQLNASAGTNNDDGGQVEIAADNITSSGVVSADAFRGGGGSVTFDSTGTTALVGESRVSVTSAKGVGGSAHVLGNEVSLADSASVDASGDSGGGTILVGGDYQGRNAGVRNADNTTVAENVTLTANAGTHGDGGKVIVWSDDTTHFSGSLEARGGSEDGDGGFAEVSGKKLLDISGAVDLTADNGATGTLLLDPKNIIVADTDPGGTTVVAATTEVDEFADNENNDSFISTGLLETFLITAAVVLQASNDITIGDGGVTAADDVDASGVAGDFGLSLEAGRSILINNDILLRG